MTSRAVERDYALAGSQEGDARGGPEGSQHFVFADGAGEFHAPGVQVAGGVGGYHGDGHHIQIWDDGLGVRALMRGDDGLGHDRVHHAAVVGFPRVGRAADEHPARLLQQPGVLKRAQRTDDAGGVARNHTSRVAANDGFVVGLRHKRMAGSEFQQH